MDYKKLIIEATNAENWNEVVRLGNEAKLNNNDESVLGIKRGYINVFKYASLYYSEREKYKAITDGLIALGYDVTMPRTAAEINRKEFKDKFTPDFYNSTYCVIFTDSLAACNNLSKGGYPIQYFTLGKRVTTNYKGNPSKTTYYVSNDTEKYKFNDFNQLKTSLRDDRINEIFED